MFYKKFCKTIHLGPWVSLLTANYPDLNSLSKISPTVRSQFFVKNESHGARCIVLQNFLRTIYFCKKEERKM
jgi:hypothetical protein